MYSRSSLVLNFWLRRWASDGAFWMDQWGMRDWFGGSMRS